MKFYKALGNSYQVNSEDGQIIGHLERAWVYADHKGEKHIFYCDDVQDVKESIKELKKGK